MKKSRKQLPKIVQRIKSSGAGIASTTRDRARTFTDRKKAKSRNACRGKQGEE